MPPENEENRLLRINDTVFLAELELGVSAHQAGRFEEALTYYRTALARAPQDAEISSLIGLSLAKSGRAGEALPYLGRAVAREPDQAGFRLNLAEGLIALKEYDRAREELQAVIAREPAAELVAVAAILRMARLELDLSHPEVAKEILGAAETHLAQNPGFLALQCEVLAALSQWPALWAKALVASRLQPGSSSHWRMLARAAFEQGQFRAATEAYARVLALAPPSAEDLTAYAGLCLHALALDDAAAALDQAEVLAPELPEMLSKRALLHMYFGRFDEAGSYCRRCLARDPENVSAYATLIRLTGGRLDDMELETLSRLSRRTEVHPDQRIPPAFAVAHIHDARGDFAAAFAACNFAHEQCLARDLAEGRGYDAAVIERRIRRLMAKTPATISTLRAASGPGPTPIFIVGMPRSGTTLIESVLGAHSRVFACGERLLMRRILQAWLELDAGRMEPDAATLSGWARAYLQELPALGAADHFTDKHPLNFEAIGLITRLFPDAAIIHVRRNPVETCLSIFRQEFNKLWTFAHRLSDIGHYYGQYALLMAHWERHAPGRVTTIQYENFAGGFEQGAANLVAACGLGWEPQCLEFQRTQRAIATFSTVQARDQVAVRNGRAGRYAQDLGPLLEALTAGGVDLETGQLGAERLVQDTIPGR
jgi:tetratricopeptide (TPR) repeat protein